METGEEKTFVEVREIPDNRKNRANQNWESFENAK